MRRAWWSLVTGVGAGLVVALAPFSCTTTTCEALCVYGCCDAKHQCLRGDSTSACGATGNLCTACGAGESCVNGSCVVICDAKSCANGCCTLTNECMPAGPQQCRTGGALCVGCSAPAVCSNGACLSPECLSLQVQCEQCADAGMQAKCRAIVATENPIACRNAGISCEQ